MKMIDPLNIASLLPIAVTLVISIALRDVILGLFLGLLSGVLMVYGPNPLQAVNLLVRDYLVPQVIDPYNAGVLILLAFIGGFVALMETSGGGEAFTASVKRFVKNTLRLQVSAWLGGIVVFFSDLGTPLIVGPIFQTLVDRIGVSREKLAFIIDSTASPVAILVPFIGWGVYIMGLLAQQFEVLDITTSDFEGLIGALPYQFYAWLSLIAIPTLAFAKFDFGPMLAAEGRAFLKSTDICETPALKNSELPPRAKTSFVWLPLVILGAVLGLSLGPLGFPFVAISGSDFRAGLSTAYVYAAVSLVLLMAFYKVRSTMDSLKVYLNGMGRMMHVAALLILAWALSDLLSEIGADTYISQVVVANIAPGLFAVLIFMTSCLISFATGSSWGTFAIMFPLIVPAAFAISAPLSVCIGAVLSGGLFGDHCSPISETTILSSMGAGCEPIEHFRTQLPYALANGFLSLIGFLMAGFYPNAGILMVLIALQGLAIFSLRKHVNMK
tara:strand:+ start:196 stop:1692 length:1497 start_codon:yes stop_codon:yes gene_type:complete